MGRRAFHSQVYSLTLKFGIHQELDAYRTIYEDAEVFAENLHREGHLAGRDYAACRRLYETIVRSIDPPDLLVYLRSGLRTIRRRGRPYEEGIDVGYLRDLNRLYDRWILPCHRSPVGLAPEEPPAHPQADAAKALPRGSRWSG